MALTEAIGQISEKWNLEIIVKLAQLAINATLKIKSYLVCITVYQKLFEILHRMRWNIRYNI